MTPEEQREYMRKWREAHPDYNRNYYKVNRAALMLKSKHRYCTDVEYRERIQTRAKARYAEDAEYRERVLKRAKERYQNDSDFRQKRLAYQKEYKRMMKLALKDETNEQSEV